jgi:hypothetical protein
VLALTATGCTGDSGPSADGRSGSAEQSASASAGGDGSPSPSESPEPYLPVPKNVTLTDPGTGLKVGERGTVAWRLDKKKIGALNITVTKIEKVSLAEFVGWRLDEASRNSTPYFVRVKLRNVGRSDLAGRSVPLYAVDKTNTLIQASSFQSSFRPCPSTPLPKKFVRDKSAQVCLVYLVPKKGTLTAISFRPSNDFNPVTWSGKAPEKAKDKKGKKNKSTKAADKPEDQKQNG